MIWHLTVFRAQIIVVIGTLFLLAVLAYLHGLTTRTDSFLPGLPFPALPLVRLAEEQPFHSRWGKHLHSEDRPGNLPEHQELAAADGMVENEILPSMPERQDAVAQAQPHAPPEPECVFEINVGACQVQDCPGKWRWYILHV